MWIAGNREPEFIWKIPLPDGFLPGLDVFPGNAYPVIRKNPLHPEQLEAVLMRWGLVPHWSTTLEDIEKYGSKTFNARAETAQELPTFRDSFQRRRCLIQIAAFYEWRKIDKFKEKHQIVSSSGGPLILAGLWDRAFIEAEPLDSFTVLTCPANALLDDIHQRMPVILGQKAAREWLDGKTDLHDLLRPCPSHWLEILPANEQNNMGLDLGEG
ncbi:DUF159 family protein [Deinococcus roseus]|uniref:Abasic site processing protein n=1 Tax=Deinococcus roseus TaxID=392414 RepID=A0ABQ2D2D3_9DEIO|nr:DUF159 family protein [Deinococcus roseus]